jgi:hypothetical protein
MKYLIVATFVGVICFNLGKSSVETHVIVPTCANQENLVLTASRFSQEEVVCVYIEPWKIRGKTKRIENVIQKKTS